MAEETLFSLRTVSEIWYAFCDMSARRPPARDGFALRLTTIVALVSLLGASVPLAHAVTDAVTTALQPFTVAVISPPNGATVSGVVPLSATTAQAAASGTFMISSGATSTVVSLPGAKDSVNPLAWKASWNTGGIPAGSYVVTFSAIRSVDGATATSARTVVTVAAGTSTINALDATTGSTSATGTGTTSTPGTTTSPATASTTTAPTLTSPGTTAPSTNTATTTTTATTNTNVSPPSDVFVPPTIKVTAPLAGAVLTGGVSMSAGVSASADSVMFILTPTAAGSPLESAGVLGQDGLWHATMSSNQVANGSYLLVARGIFGGILANSDPVSVIVSNAVTALPVSVNLTAPMVGATVSGGAPLAASTSVSASGLTFVISTSGGTNVASIPGTPSGSTGVSWTATWSTSAVADGSYQILAVAVSGA
ncbi:MAG: hypothetical protein ACRDT5_18585, partial [Mycobacterium sp.]